jgi:hypothetical protein
MSTKKAHVEELYDDEDSQWEELIPSRFKQVCKKDTWEPFHVAEDKNWW